MSKLLRLPRRCAPRSDISEKKFREKGDNPCKEKGQSPFLEEERILRRIPLQIIALSFLIALASLLFFDSMTAVFILAGGAFSALSFIWLKQTISRLIPLKNGDSSYKDEEKEKKGTGIFFEKKRSLSPFSQSSLSEAPLFRKALLSTLPLYGLRLVLILAIFFIIIFFFSQKAIAFVVGFSSIVPVFLIEAVIALTRIKQWKN